MPETLEHIKKFEDMFGGTWVTVKFYDEISTEIEKLKFEEMRFCEAVLKSRTVPGIVTSTNLQCLGARRNFNWEKDKDTIIAQKLSEKKGIDIEKTKRMLAHTPRLTNSYAAIGLGMADKPDCIVSYLQPETVMRILRAFQKIHGNNLNESLSTIMSVCGYIIASCFTKNKICISFGCDQCRETGGLSPDQVAMGIPCALIEPLLSAVDT